MASSLTTPSGMTGLKRHSCTHSKAIWGALQVNYMTDGTAIVWQGGSCSECMAKLIVEYARQEPKAA